MHILAGSFENRRRRLAAPLVAFSLAVAAFSASASNTCMSSPTSVFLAPERTHLWSTGCGSHFSVPIDYPEGATSATLEVVGDGGYSSTYSGLTEDSVVVDLPAAVSPDKENVYTLTLTFAGSAVVRTARLGGIFGYDGSDTGHTRCVGPLASSRWSRVRESAVLPIPYGATALTIGGTPIDLGPDCPASWYWHASPPPGESETYVLSVGSEDYEAVLFGVGGMFIFFR